jgi:hypothetical protein
VLAARTKYLPQAIQTGTRNQHRPRKKKRNQEVTADA